ncbi:uncharacterized protein B0P05DRAFT_541898 [Gilbertella persicaria]|uniref:F-box domain-containing protein n=1 Tax=Rhizopus stolonifer TaxID=4846 RepID=A0A367KWV8_RHIST|nr:uncharacterized protein B0P05DRAFT_541898 [Gilbertella persicaria]KAI8078970.1 hypothetical protein B0P05DRAFT_541898 [Gilbertella persicaria]RCI06699.1 hypothetical protein CU098_013770 [Rhizopus stolonifer]
MTLAFAPKSLFKKIHFKKVKKTAMMHNFISNLPKELLLCIYQQLDTLECTQAFALTCRAFYQVAIQPRSKAAWIVTRFGPRFALYYALLSIPQHCHGQFIHTLFHLGAHLPHCLLQGLLQHYGKPIEQQDQQRRGSHMLLDTHTYFSRTIQQLSFDGFATLVQKGHLLYKDIHPQQDDLSVFLSQVDHDHIPSTMIHEQWFFPAIFKKTTLPSRPLLKLVQQKPDVYQYVLAPVFEFDPLARTCLWETSLNVLFEEAFRSSEPTQERIAQLEAVGQLFVSKSKLLPMLVGPLNDQQLFCQVFSNFFTKYPVGYCQEKTMIKLLKLLKTYIQPQQFKMDMALEHIVQANMARSDTVESVDQFLKNHTH